MDHARHFQRAKSITDRLFHNDCGGRVTQDDDYGYSTEAKWECSGCPQKWSHQTMKRFSPQDIADRFHVRPVPESGSMTLVLKTEGTDAFHSLVPTHEAHKYKKVDTKWP